MNNIFRFKVLLRGGFGMNFPASYSTRTLEIYGKDSLKDLAEAILDTYDFDLDHAFGFYDNPKNYYNSQEIYTIFADMDDLQDDPLINGKSVENTKISAVFDKDKIMLFMFDYGDEWIFHVRCLSIGAPVKGVKYPMLVASTGETPEQYPDFE